MSQQIQEADKKNVLLIEDDPTQWFYMKRMLSGNYKVQHATNGIDALRLLDETNFDIVLMDINLGDEHMSGFHLVNYIRKQDRFRDVRIFAVTAEKPDSRDGHSVFSFDSFDEFIPKPVEKESLIRKMEKIVPIRT